MPEPRLLASAPSHHAKQAWEAAVEALAPFGLNPNSACRELEAARTRIARLTPADRRWAAQLRLNRRLGDVVRGLSGAGAGVANTAVQALEQGADELAGATGAKPGSALHAAVVHLLLSPPTPEVTDDAA